MPGLKQLKKFSNKLKALGNEVEIRTKRGDIIEEVPFPEGISEDDDSGDFRYGLPIPDPETGEILLPKGPEVDYDALASELLHSDSNELDLSLFMDEAPPEESEDQKGTDVSALDLQGILASFDQPDSAADSDAQIAASKPDTESEFTEDAEPIDEVEELEEVEALEEIEEPDDFDLQGEVSASPEDFGSLGSFEHPIELGEGEPLSEAEDFDEPAQSSAVDFSPDTETPQDFDTLPSFDDFSSAVPNFDFESLVEEPGGTTEEMSSEEPFEPVSPPKQASPFDTDPFGDTPDYQMSTSFGDPLESSEFSNEDSLEMGEIPSFDAPPSIDLDEGNESDDVEHLVSVDDGHHDFTIPGFSDFDPSSDLDVPKSQAQKKKQKAVPIAELEEDKNPNEFTEEEYKTFLKNLNYYPLNLRLAVQELIVSNEFTDEVVSYLIRMIVKKAPVRQLAAHVGKLLDRSIDVPRNYEKRSAAQYAEYKASIQYQLKNRILPALIIGAALFVLGFSIMFLANRFVIRPLKAEGLYKEGYTLLQNNFYPQSEIKFSEAITYQKTKKWFFAYARGYREHKQYDRARNMYELAIDTFPKDKTMGLEYAWMELDDLSNYENAVRILRRKVLDRFINDKDAMLLLGDVYLEWATEKDPSKFEDARAMYAQLIQLNGNTNEYLARMMRYFIRTDNLREVLPLKAHFYSLKGKSKSKNNKILPSQDLIELSGYMLDKLYADLAPADEYLRSYIEDVRDLLEWAIDADKTVPEAYYNMARYFVAKQQASAAEPMLLDALKIFERSPKRNKSRVVKNIDTYRLLGELYSKNKEFLKAEEQYGKGIEMFETEAAAAAIPASPKIGRLYSDMADLDYFISGDFDHALRNYQHAIAKEYETPSINYRIGYIHYINEDYSAAMNSFIKTAQEKGTDTHVLLSLANTFSMLNNTFAAQGYYDRLLDLLDRERARSGVLLPQVRPDQADLVQTYMRAANNYGVVLQRLAQRTGDSSKNALSAVYLSESMRAWDALTRNQETMVRLGGSNLAEQNLKYLSLSSTAFEPAIYIDVPDILVGEIRLKQ